MHVCRDCGFYDKFVNHEGFGDCMFIPPPWLKKGLHWASSEEGEYHRAGTVRATDYCSLHTAHDEKED